MNQVVLIGNLTRDPELRYSTGASQTAICKFTLAVNDRQRNPQTQQWEDRANFIPIVVFGKQAENCDRYLAKGRKAAVSGRIQTGSYVNKEGQKVYTTEVIANNVEFLGSRNDQGGFGGQNQGGFGGQNQGGFGGQDQGGFGGQDQGGFGGQDQGGFAPAPMDSAPAGDASQPPAGFGELTDDDIPF